MSPEPHMPRRSRARCASEYREYRGAQRAKKENQKVIQHSQRLATVFHARAARLSIASAAPSLLVEHHRATAMAAL
jgi:GrpB-like predicted nucleotidyltransferase (UPF0157 family)